MTTSNDPDEIRADIERTRAALSDNVDDLAESVKPKNVAGRQVGKVKEAASNLKDRVMGSEDDDYSGSAVGTVGDKASSAKDTVSEKASDARDAVRQAPSRMKRRAQGNPLAAGMIAFGLGMLVSSLIPSTEKEREAVSQLQDNLEPVKEKAPEVAQDMAGSLKPAAQEAAESLKTTYTVTLGGSKEFNRLVDIDLRRKEFLITLRETSVRPDRAKEMKDELDRINEDVNGLKEIVKGQVTQAVLRDQEQTQMIESIAIIGLVHLTLESFSTSSDRAGLSRPSTKVGPNVVTDLGGSLSTVRTSDGRTYRCSTLLVAERGAGIKCEAPGGN